MMRKLLVAALATVVAGFTASAPADAGGRGWHGKSYRGSGPQVRGYIARRGGYSYSYADAINTYGDGNGRYGRGNVLRDPSMEKNQSSSGPFDSGFFFNSGSSGSNNSYGGDSPYMN